MPVDPTDPQLMRDRENFNSSAISEMFSEIRNGLWHVTGTSQYKQILASGHIVPSRPETSFTFPQTANSFGLKHNAVCLFDFSQASDDECILQYYKWSIFFFHFSPITFALELDRESLPSTLIPNSAALKPSHPSVWIPYVEAWHPGPIPIRCIRRAIVIFQRGKPIYMSGPHHDPLFADQVPLLQFE